MAPVTTKGCVDTQGLGQTPETMLVSKRHAFSGTMVASGPKLLPRIMSGSMALQQPGLSCDT